MKFKKCILFILIVISQVFISCGDSTVKQVKSLMQIGDYSQAITLLKQHVSENPKHYKSRYLLYKCYETKEDWNLATEQVQIMRNISSADSLLFIQMRLEVLAGNFEKFDQLQSQADGLLAKINDSASKRFKIDTLAMKDSLNEIREEWAQLNYLFSLQSSLEQKYYSYADSLGLDNYYIAKGLYGLHNNWEWSFEEDFKEAIRIDSSMVKYIKSPIIQYIQNRDKPEIPMYNPESYYSEVTDYFETNADLYQLIEENEKAINELDKAIYWNINNPNREDWKTMSLYTSKIGLAEKDSTINKIEIYRAFRDNLLNSPRLKASLDSLIHTLASNQDK